MRTPLILLCGAGVAVLVPSASAALLFNDDYSTFNNGNLVGQGAYTQLGGIATLPLRVSDGRVVIPGAQTANNQDALRNQTATLAAGGALYYGATFRVNTAPTAETSYFLALRSVQGTSSFDNIRIALRQGTTAGTFQLGLRFTGQTGNPFTWGSDLAIGVDHALIAEAEGVAGADNDRASLFVNPVSLNRAGNTAYASVTNLVANTDFSGAAGVTISQFGSATIPSPDLSLGRLVMSDDFTSAATAVPEPGTMAALGLGALALAARRRRNAK